MPPSQQGLSLSLTPQQPIYGSCRTESEIPAAISPTNCNDIRMSGGSSSSASGLSNGISGVQSVLLGSKYLKAAQWLLDEFVRVRNRIGLVVVKKSNLVPIPTATPAPNLILSVEYRFGPGRDEVLGRRKFGGRHFSSKDSIQTLKSSKYSSGKVRILSIVGNGTTDGNLVRKSLAHVEAYLRKKSGDPDARIADYFNVVAGTGNGMRLYGRVTY
ncbi:hypothetical protein NE237_031627 [Protea cynaroides]|uniref:Uncharacterized protein n=1 Tax=Protea cynaroides TaxID=273540 RepID=A0A9Q0R2R7_9MAGN|nr:hypothetical protein NE237_031627 [Protea cynaroides]